MFRSPTLQRKIPPVVVCATRFATWVGSGEGEDPIPVTASSAKFVTAIESEESVALMLPLVVSQKLEILGKLSAAAMVMLPALLPPIPIVLAVILLISESERSNSASEV